MLYQLSNKVTVLGKVIVKPDKSFSFLSYLLRGEKNILIDTVPARGAEEFLQELDACLPLEALDGLILNHSEEDHSGALAALLARRPDLPVYCSPACQARLAVSHPGTHVTPVSHESVLSLGDFRFRFFHTPGLHWDDNMTTYLEQERILFSNDLFGQSLGAHRPLDSEFSPQALLDGVDAYFKKVFAPASPQEKAVVPALCRLALTCVAPGHGVVLQEQLGAVLDYYQKACS